MASLARSCHFSARTVATSNAANYTSTLSPSWQSVNVYGTINEDLEIAHFPLPVLVGGVAFSFRVPSREQVLCEIALRVRNPIRIKSRTKATTTSTSERKQISCRRTQPTSVTRYRS